MRSRSGFSLLEILIVVALMAILATLLLVAINQARHSARSVQCLNNLRQISLGFRAYADIRRDKLPEGIDNPWYIEIAPYTEFQPSLLHCPAGPDKESIGYNYRDDLADVPETKLGGKEIDKLAKSEVVVVFDDAPSWHTFEWRNVATIGGSAESMHEDDFEDNLLLDVERGDYFFK